jgi:hypothetical protein
MPSEMLTFKPPSPKTKLTTVFVFIITLSEITKAESVLAFPTAI